MLRRPFTAILILGLATATGLGSRPAGAQRSNDSALSEQLHIGLVTSYFGRHPKLQEAASQLAVRVAEQYAADGPVVVVPFEIDAGEPIRSKTSELPSVLPSAPFAGSTGGHDNEAASRLLASKSNRWILISNSPSISRSKALSGGPLPKGSWRKSVASPDDRLSLLLIGSPALDSAGLDSVALDPIPRDETEGVRTTTITTGTETKNSMVSQGISVLVLAVVLWLVWQNSKIHRLLRKPAGQGSKPSDSGTAEGSSLSPSLAPAAVAELDTSEFKHLVGELEQSVRRMTTDQSDESAQLRQNLAELRADVRRFDDTVFTFSSLLMRMQADEQNDELVRGNCTYLLGRLKRYFERCGLDLIVPSMGEEFQDDLHSIVATVPADSKHPHMTIVGVDEIGIRRGQDVRQQAKVIVAKESVA